MEKLKSFVGVFLATTLGCLAALKLYEQLNKPKVAAPATTPGATAAE